MSSSSEKIEQLLKIDIDKLNYTPLLPIQISAMEKDFLSPKLDHLERIKTMSSFKPEEAYFHNINKFEFDSEKCTFKPLALNLLELNSNFFQKHDETFFRKSPNLPKKRSDEFIPVLQIPIEDMEEDPLSKKLRCFDNVKITLPPSNSLGVYINTNESNTKKTASKLAELPRIDLSCHIGFSGWHNFDIMAQRESSRGLICDLNPENALFLSHVLKYLRSYEDRIEFINSVSSFIQKIEYYGVRTNPYIVKFSMNVSDDPLYKRVLDKKAASQVKIELERETSWLYTDQRYAHIRKLALEDKIALITENICAKDTFSSISQLLKEHSVQVDTVYISNIAKYMSDSEERSNFIETIRSLLSEKDSILIGCKAHNLNQVCATQLDVIKLGIEAWIYSEEYSIQKEEDLGIHDSIEELEAEDFSMKL